MNDKSVCPKCGLPLRDGSKRVFTCGSEKRNERTFQTEGCRIRELEAENARLREELQKQIVWADDATPFSPSQVKDLLNENARLRNEIELWQRTPYE